MLNLVLLAFSFVCFCIAAWQMGAPYYNRLIAIGLAFLVASMLFGGLASAHLIH